MKLPLALTRGELNVLYWSAMGKTAKEVACIINLSPETVSSYRKRCLRELNASNIIQAVFLAQIYGLLT